VHRLDSQQFRVLSGEFLSSGRGIRFRAVGASMYPSICDGDYVTVAPVSFDAIGVGDVVLSSNHGRLLVHRVVDLDEAGFSTRGDALPLGDERSQREALLGRVVAIEPLRIGFVVTRTVARALGPASMPAIRSLLWCERARLKLARRVRHGRNVA
jgi:signal peptidase I